MADSETAPVLCGELIGWRFTPVDHDTTTMRLKITHASDTERPDRHDLLLTRAQMRKLSHSLATAADNLDDVAPPPPPKKRWRDLIARSGR